MRKTLVLVLSLVVGLFGAPPAVADPEPDNWIWQAVGPVTTPTITGSVASSNDVDWYMFYAASQTQLSLTVGANPCGSDLDVYLYSSDGSYLRGMYADSRRPTTVTYTTPIGVNQYFMSVDGQCDDDYRIDIAPATGLVSGAPMPTVTVPTGEPNESADQAQGPLKGGTIYTGITETSNDEDWFYFFASSAFSVTTTAGTRCDGDVTLYDEDRDYLSSDYIEVNEYSRITYTPASWQAFYLDLDSDCVGGAYRFSISPVSAIRGGPAPAPTAPAPTAPAPSAPAPMNGLTYRKTRKKVVVYWSAVPGATGYQVRVRKGSKWRAWKFTANTWKSYKRKKMPKAMKVRARATNAVGAGATQTIRVRR